VTSPLRGPQEHERRRLRRRSTAGRAAQATGPPLWPQGCSASRCARQPFRGCPRPRRPLRPLGPGRTGRPRPAPAMRSARNPAVAEHRPLSPVQAVVSAVPRKVPERHPDGSRLVSRPLFRQPAPEPAPPHRQAETEPKPSRRGHALIVKGRRRHQLPAGSRAPVKKSRNANVC